MFGRVWQERPSQCSRSWRLGARTSGLFLLAVVISASTGSAQDAWQLQDLTRPISAVEFGLGDVSTGSFKAGEFTGLQKAGGIGIGNFDFRGGSTYSSDSARRWRVSGRDLGLAGRNISGEVGTQGKVRLTFMYDSLLRNRSDTFQSVFDGAGTTALTLPGAWRPPTVAASNAGNTAINTISARGLVRALATARYVNLTTTSPTLGGLLTPTPTQMAISGAAMDTDLGLFRHVDLATTRTRFDVGLDYQFSPRLGVSASFKPEHREGLKPLGVVSRATGGDIAATVPDPIDTQHNQVDASVLFKAGKAFLQAGYNGSFFNNRVSSVAFENWALGPAGPATLARLSSAPGSQFSQVTVTGGYRKSTTTNLTMTASYARNTQNDPFLVDDSTPVVPVSSLNGLVVNTSLDARFTTALAKRLHATAAYKYDNRDNQTAVHIFQFMDANQPLAANPSFPGGPTNPLGAVLATNAGANRSYSKQLQQITGDLDWRLASWQSVKGGYELQAIDRACPGSWVSCANADTTHEHGAHAEWHAHLRDQIVGRASYAFSRRRTPFYNENSFLALVPYANVSPVGALGGATLYSYLLENGLTGWGPSRGYEATTGNANVFFPANSETHLSTYAWENRISELPGLRRYEVADRDRGRVRTSLDWMASEQLSLRVGVTADRSDYVHSRYGLIDSSNSGVSLDGTYAASAFTTTAFYSYERLRSASAGNTFTVNSNGTNVGGLTTLSGNQGCNPFTAVQERNNNAKRDPCLDWSTDRRDRVHTVGLELERQIGPLGLSSNVTLSRARSFNDVTGGNYANNILIGPGAEPTTIAAFYIRAVALPQVTTDSAEVRASGVYALGQRMAVRLSYLFSRMRSSDYAYEGLQIGEGTVVNVLPTVEQPFNYGVHVFGVSYSFAF